LNVINYLLPDKDGKYRPVSKPPGMCKRSIIVFKFESSASPLSYLNYIPLKETIKTQIQAIEFVPAERRD